VEVIGLRMKWPFLNGAGLIALFHCWRKTRSENSIWHLNVFCVKPVESSLDRFRYQIEVCRSRFCHFGHWLQRSNNDWAMERRSSFIVGLALAAQRFLLRLCCVHWALMYVKPLSGWPKRVA